MSLDNRLLMMGEGRYDFGNTVQSGLTIDDPNSFNEYIFKVDSATSDLLLYKGDTSNLIFRASPSSFTITPPLSITSSGDINMNGNDITDLKNLSFTNTGTIITTPTYTVLQQDNDNFLIRNPRNGDIAFFTNDNANMVLNSSGYLGILDTTPSYPLDVNGVINTTSNYNINGSSVLNSTTLGSGIVNSSLTSVGTLSSLTTTGNINSVSGSYQIGGLNVLTSNTLGSGIVNSSLTSVGTLSSLTTTGNISSLTGNINSVSGSYQIGGINVLTSNTLGSGIVNSSLTSVGTLTGLTMGGDINLNGNDLLNVGSFGPLTSLEISGGELITRGINDTTIDSGIWTETNYQKCIRLNNTGGTYRNYYIGMLGDGATNTNKLAFAADAGGGADPNMLVVIDNTGNLTVDNNLGVGTNSPTEKLDVVGNIKVSGEVGGSITCNNLGSLGYILLDEKNIVSLGTNYTTNVLNLDFGSTDQNALYKIIIKTKANTAGDRYQIRGRFHDIDGEMTGVDGHWFLAKTFGTVMNENNGDYTILATNQPANALTNYGIFDITLSLFGNDELLCRFTGQGSVNTEGGGNREIIFMGGGLTNNETINTRITGLGIASANATNHSVYIRVYRLL